MPNKQYRGFVVTAPPHLNPKQEPDRYVFSGAAVSNGKGFICSLRALPLPGYVPPEEFAADVAARKPLHGTLELFASKFDLGTFSYEASNGDPVSARAEDVMELTKEQLRGPPKQPEPTLRPLPEPKVEPPPVEEDFGLSP